PGDWTSSNQPDTCHGGWDHRPLLDGPRTVGVSCAATALDTPEETWASLAYPKTPDGAMVLVTTVKCRATQYFGHGVNPLALEVRRSQYLLSSCIGTKHF